MKKLLVRRFYQRWTWVGVALSTVTALGTVSAQAMQAGDTITIGVVMPITGREGKPGQYQREGIELAIKKINDAGGIVVKGKKLKIKEVFYDDGSDSAKSASLTERAMSSDNVTAVLGGYSTALGEAEAVMPDRYLTPWIPPAPPPPTIFSHAYQYLSGTLSPTPPLTSP